MDKAIRIIGIIGAIAAIVFSVLDFAKGITVPGGSAMGLAVVMGSLLYSTRKNYLAGKVEKGRWRLILVLASLAIVLNIFSSVTQIMIAIGQ